MMTLEWHGGEGRGGGGGLSISVKEKHMYTRDVRGRCKTRSEYFMISNWTIVFKASYSSVVFR